MTNDAISLMKMFILEVVLTDAINNNDGIVSITSKFCKLIKTYFTGVILYDSSSPKIISKTRNLKQPKRTRRLGQRINVRDYKTSNAITRTVPTVRASHTHSRRARRKITMATLKLQLSTARRQTKLATRTC